MPMKSAFAALTLLLIGVAPPSALAQTQAQVPAAKPQAPRNMAQPLPGSPEADLLAAEDARFQAQIAHQAPVVASYMADELIYTHATGRVQSKADYVAEVATGNTPWRQIEPSSRTVYVSGNVGFTHATIYTVTGDRSLTGSYLAAYIKRGGRWLLLFWQTSLGRNPDDKGPPPQVPTIPLPKIGGQ